MSTYHNHLAVIGRVDGNDDDDVFLYEHMTIEQARTKFAEDQRDAVDREVPDEEIYLNYVLTSESPIIIQERNV